MPNISRLCFGSRMPVVTIGKDGYMATLWDDVRHTNPTRRNMCVKDNPHFSQCLLQLNFDRSVSVGLWGLSQSSLTAPLSTCFIKPTHPTHYLESSGLTLPCLVATPGAVDLRPLACTYTFFATHWAILSHSVAKAVSLFAFVRAKALWRFLPSSVKRVEIIATMGAFPNSLHSHGLLYHIEERYCEIAAKRLAQSVMPL